MAWIITLNSEQPATVIDDMKILCGSLRVFAFFAVFMFFAFRLKSKIWSNRKGREESAKERKEVTVRLVVHSELPGED